MSEHTIELLEERKRPPGSAYTVRHCDKQDCHERATHVARRSSPGCEDTCAFVCTEHAIPFCLQHGLACPYTRSGRPKIAQQKIGSSLDGGGHGRVHLGQHGET